MGQAEQGLKILSLESGYRAFRKSTQIKKSTLLVTSVGLHETQSF